MVLIAVESTNIAAIGYEPATNTLGVKFKNPDNGMMYQYYGVENSLWEDFKASPSKGNFFHTFIKTKFKSEKVPVPVAKA